MEHALPRRTAGIPRSWSLCMTSENHGTVGPAGCTFSHAPEKHERVLVVEVPTAAGAPADQINLRLVGARKDLPAAEFEGYVDGEPLVRWMDRDNMPRVGTKLFAHPAANKAEVDLTGLLRFDFCDINDDEFVERPDGAYFLAHEVEARCTIAAPVAAQAGQVAVPLPAWRDIKAVLTNLIAVASIRIADKDDDDDQLIDDAAEAVRQLDAAMQASTSGERQEGGD